MLHPMAREFGWMLVGQLIIHDFESQSVHFVTTMNEEVEGNVGVTIICSIFRIMDVSQGHGDTSLM